MCKGVMNVVNFKPINKNTFLTSDAVKLYIILSTVINSHFHDNSIKNEFKNNLLGAYLKINLKLKVQH